MKKTMQKTVLALVAGSLMGLVGTAQAAGPMPGTTVVTATADLVFTAPATATASITPVANLLAEKTVAGTNVATAKFTASAGDVAYRWTPGSGTISDNSNGEAQFNKVTGKGGNTLDLEVAANGGKNEGKTGYPWWVPVTPNTSTINIFVNILNTHVIKADTYPISLDATVWQR